MKKITLLIIIITIISGCEKSKIEVVADPDEEYYTLNYLDGYPTSTKTLKELIKAVSDIAQDRAEREKKIITLVANYSLYINEEGRVVKIKPINRFPDNGELYPVTKIIHTNDEEVTEKIVEILEKQTFLPARKDGKTVKFIYPFDFAGVYGSKYVKPEDIVAQKEDKNINKSGAYKSPVLLEQPKPKYPEDAKNSGIEGKVFVKAIVDEFGRVESTTVIKGTGTSLDTAAENSIKKALFKPGFAIKDNKPIKAEVVVPILFRLE